MASQTQLVKMYICGGWQNVAEHSQTRREYPIGTAEYPEEHAHAAMLYNHARNKSLKSLVKGLKEEANVSSLRFIVIDELA